jgi:hypothetical protein
MPCRLLPPPLVVDDGTDIGTITASVGGWFEFKSGYLNYPKWFCFDIANCTEIFAWEVVRQGNNDGRLESDDFVTCVLVVITPDK